MTATLEEQPTTQEGGIGRVVRVIGPVVDVEFAPDEMPEIYNALTVERTLGDDTRKLTLEVAGTHRRQHGARDLDAADRRSRPRRAGAGHRRRSTVPVGDVTLGHVWNVLGEPLDVAADADRHQGALADPPPVAAA